MIEETEANSQGAQSKWPDEVIEAMFLLITAAVGFFLNVIVIASVVSMRSRRTISSVFVLHGCLLDAINASVVSMRSRRTISSVFVLHGCLLDAIKCLYSVPFATSLLRRGPPHSCAVLGGSFVLLVTASAVNIVATVCSEAYSFRLASLRYTFVALGSSTVFLI